MTDNETLNPCIRCLMLVAVCTAQATHFVSSDPADWNDGTWILPVESTIPNDAEGDMIRY
jgi:hypothetical protein